MTVSWGVTGAYVLYLATEHVMIENISLITQNKPK